MEQITTTSCNPKEKPILSLAFLGDCVFELLVREKLVCGTNRPVDALHRASVQQVCCEAQAAGVQKMLPMLTEEEMSIFKRGRNAKVTAPKHASVAEYHQATGLEALFGYLYLQGNTDRLLELFHCMIGETS